MRSAKAWRCVLVLPDNQILAAGLTSLIESKVRLTLISADGITVTIDPAFIVDVKTKGRRFHLIMETCFEHQAEHGPRLTAMVNQPVRVSVEPTGQTTTITEAPPVEGMIGAAEIRGLHSTFFRNNKFQQFIEHQTGVQVRDEERCKSEFKRLHNVESCKELKQTVFREFLREFNQWNTRGAA
jgi:hypothetical protein